MALETPSKPEAPATTHTVVHYEIPCQDPKRLVSFYSAVFGWQFEGAPNMEDYKIADIGAGRRPLSVAIYAKENEGAGPVNYISVESVADYARKVKDAGGTVMHEFEVEGMGKGAIALDPEGHLLGLWEPTM